MIYIRISWAYLIVASLIYFIKNIFLTDQSFISDPGQRTILFWSIGVCVFIFLGHFLKGYLFQSGLLEYKFIYYIEKMTAISIMAFVIVYTNTSGWFYLGIILPTVITCLVKGPKPGLSVLAGSLAIHLLLFLHSNIPELSSGEMQLSDFNKGLFTIAVAYTMILLIAIFVSLLYQDRIESEIRNKSYVEQFDEKYMKLELTKEEARQQNEKLVSSNSKLEESNKKLSKSIAEFYTLHQISQEISSILDVKELLKHLNDIILGVMGVSYSTIILYDENINRLKVHTTNINDINDIATMTDNINNGVLMDALNNGQNILENNVDYMQYIFTCGRDINSLICIPLNTKSRKFGLILIEHTYANAFNEENVRLLSIIAQQVGIVMENAELYNRMTELARRDGLTGIFNRQYFQERLDIEYQNAKQNNYSLSLAIFDIDFFKKFNDTYGHLFGDKVLISVVKAVKATLRKNDIIARFGGEEFIILFPRTNLNEACDKVETLKKLISQYVVNDNLVSVSVTASFGVSSFDECVMSESELLRTADDALYEAKAAGRNCVRSAKKLMN